MFLKRLNNKTKRLIAEKLHVKKKDISIKKIDSEYLMFDDPFINDLLSLINKRLKILNFRPISFYNYTELEIEVNSSLETTLTPILLYEQTDKNKYIETTNKANELSELIKEIQKTKELIITYIQELGFALDFIPEDPSVIDNEQIFFSIIKNKKYIINFDPEISKITYIKETQLDISTSTL